MYLAHYGLTEPPFRITPNTDFFFSGARRGATLEALIYAITHDEGIVKISGEVGSGKTMLCRVLMERLPENVVIIYLANPSLAREDILYALADELDIEIESQARAATVMRALQERLLALYGEGKQVVALIDEAHAMPGETLEEIRLLSNLESNRHKLLQLVLFGQPELDATLARSDMRQLRERITHSFSLAPLGTEEIAAYLDFRMRAAGYHGPSVFMPIAVKHIARISAGLTRRINLLADKALLASYANGVHQVGKREIEAAIRDSEFSTAPATVRQSWRSGLLWSAGGAVVMLAAVGIVRLMSNTASAPADLPAAAAAQGPSPSAVETAADAAPAPATAVESPAHLPPLDANGATSTSRTPLLDKLLADNRVWLVEVPDDHWFIQLYTAIDAERPEQVESFLQQVRAAGLEMAHVHVYQLVIAKRNRFGVIYGDYVQRKDAVNVLNSLPAELKRLHPYLRQAVRLKIDGVGQNPN